MDSGELSEAHITLLRNNDGKTIANILFVINMCDPNIEEKNDAETCVYDCGTQSVFLITETIAR